MATKIFEIGLNADQYVQVAGELKREIEAIKTAQKQLDTSTQAGAEAWARNSAALKELNQQYGIVEKSIRSDNDAMVKMEQITKSVNAEMGKEIRTINEANQQITSLNKIKKTLNVNNAEEKALLDQINRKIDENTKFVKENSSEVEKQKMNIGNYSGAIDKLIPGFSSVISNLKDIKTGLQAYSTTMSATTVTTGGLSAALKIFRVALISTGIGAIVVALGSLIAFLTSTQKGIDAVTSVTRPLAAIFQSLIGVAQKIGESMFNAFSKPKEILVGLVDFMKTNLINRFKAFGVILQGIKNFDFKEVANGVAQFGTGIENVIGKTQNAVKKTNEFFTTAYNKGKEIDNLTKDVEKSTLKWNAAQIKVKDQIDEQLRISKDTSLTFAEREAAARRIIEINKANGAAEAEIIQKKIDAMKLQQSLNDTGREQQQELIDLQVQLDNAKDRGIEAELEQMRVIGGAKKEAMAASLEAQKKMTEAQKQEIEEMKAAAMKKVEIMSVELDLWKEQNREKLNGSKELTDAVLSAELAAADILRQKQKDIIESKHTDGLISETEYKLALLQNENEYLDKKAELNKQFDDIQKANRQASIQAEREQRNIDYQIKQEELALQYESEKLVEEERYLQEKDLLKQRLDDKLLTQIQYDRLLEVAKQDHANKLDIIDAQSNSARIERQQQTFSALSGLLSAFGIKSKGLSIGLAMVDTYLAAQKAYWNVLSNPINKLSPDGGLLQAQIAAGLAVVQGLAKVASIQSTKFATGGYVSGSGTGTSDSIPAMLSNGESVINARSTAMFAPILSAINQAGGGVAFAQGGVTANNLQGANMNPFAEIKVVNVVDETFAVMSNAKKIQNYANI